MIGAALGAMSGGGGGGMTGGSAGPSTATSTVTTTTDTTIQRNSGIQGGTWPPAFPFQSKAEAANAWMMPAALAFVALVVALVFAKKRR